MLHLMVSNIDFSLAQREADVAIRLTNTPPDTLIGRRVGTVSSAVYGRREYIDGLQESGADTAWPGVDCCTCHRSWTKQECGGRAHHFCVDETLLTRAAHSEGLGVSVLPCFMGDTDPVPVRCSDPRPEWDLGLWILCCTPTSEEPRGCRPFVIT